MAQKVMSFGNEGKSITIHIGDRTQVNLEYTRTYTFVKKDQSAFTNIELEKGIDFENLNVQNHYAYDPDASSLDLGKGSIRLDQNTLIIQGELSSTQKINEKIIVVDDDLPVSIEPNGDCENPRACPFTDDQLDLLTGDITKDMLNSHFAK